MNGKVKFYNEKKGFGFITGDDKKEYFFHVSKVENQEVLSENDEVEFETIETPRGEQADNIKRA